MLENPRITKRLLQETVKQLRAKTTFAKKIMLTSEKKHGLSNVYSYFKGSGH